MSYIDPSDQPLLHLSMKRYNEEMVLSFPFFWRKHMALAFCYEWALFLPRNWTKALNLTEKEWISCKST